MSLGQVDQLQDISKSLYFSGGLFGICSLLLVLKRPTYLISFKTIVVSRNLKTSNAKDDSR